MVKEVKMDDEKRVQVIKGLIEDINSTLLKLLMIDSKTGAIDKEEYVDSYNFEKVKYFLAFRGYLENKIESEEN